MESIDFAAAREAENVRRVAVLMRILGIGAPPDIAAKLDELQKDSPWRRDEIVEILIQRALSMRPMPWHEKEGR